MKVVETITENEYGSDGFLELQLETEDFSGSVSFGDGEPEDMSLDRDLSGAYDISDMLKAAYDAGVRGEEYSFEQIREEDE